MEWRQSHDSLRSGICLAIKELADDLLVMSCYRSVKGCSAVIGSLINLCPGSQEQRHNLCVPAGPGDVQRSAAFFIHLSLQVRSLGKDSEDLVAHARRHCELERGRILLGSPEV
jgi:hypothetical protein